MRVTTSSCKLIEVRLNSEDGSLWESFPQVLQTLDGVKRYVDAFRAPLQGLTLIKLQQVHALRACSLVAIPLSEERTPPPGGFPKDLFCMNLTSWAGLIQDVAQGMKVVPPNLSMEVCLEAMVLLQLLEATTGMGYCRICSQPSPRCHCEDDQYIYYILIYSSYIYMCNKYYSLHTHTNFYVVIYTIGNC